MNIGSFTMDVCMELTQEIFELIFPQGIFEWVDLIEGTREGDTGSYRMDGFRVVVHTFVF